MILEPKVFNFTHGTIEVHESLNNIAKSEYLSYTHGYYRALQDVLTLIKSGVRESKQYEDILIETSNNIHESLEKQFTH